MDIPSHDILMKEHSVIDMKQQLISINDFSECVIKNFVEKYPEDAELLLADVKLSAREQMDTILSYCVQKGYMLPELLERLNT